MVSPGSLHEPRPRPSDLAAEASKQMERMAFYPNWGFTHEPVSKAASMIADVAPGDLEDVFFVSSGSEAVESALKFARNYHVARRRRPLQGHLSRMELPRHHHRRPCGHRRAEVPQALPADAVGRPTPCPQHPRRHRRRSGERQGHRGHDPREGPETVALVIAEPVQNGRGCLVPPDGYWQELRRICDKYGVLLWLTRSSVRLVARSLLRQRTLRVSPT